jgi:hypothetical protein
MDLQFSLRRNTGIENLIPPEPECIKKKGKNPDTTSPKFFPFVSKRK